MLYGLFSVRQREGESLQDYLNRFWAFTVKLRTHDNNVMVFAFEQGVASGPFCDSLIRRDQTHEVPIHAELNTISGGFFVRGSTTTKRKRYARAVMSLETGDQDDAPEPDLYFIKADFGGRSSPRQ